MSNTDPISAKTNILKEYNLKPIISVKETRKLLGKKVSGQLSDEEVSRLIGNMSSLADRLLKAKSVPQNG